MGALFFLRRSPPPRSPPIPYTTLFRSLVDDENVGELDDAALDALQLVARARDAEEHERVDHPGDRRDRKSTRLNSSHLVISYAVFCMKKNKLKYVAVH